MTLGLIKKGNHVTSLIAGSFGTRFPTVLLSYCSVARAVGFGPEQHYFNRELVSSDLVIANDLQDWICKERHSIRAHYSCFSCDQEFRHAVEYI